MPRMMHRRAALSLAIASSTLLAASYARAALPLVVTSQLTLDGIHEYADVTVKKGGTILVRPTSSGFGWLHLRANSITVESGGFIDASGAGFQGHDGANGDQPNSTSGAGKLAGGVDMPGTGGANAGDGGQGTDPGCTLFGAIDGGKAYATPASLNLGSAGGAAMVADASLSTRGGNGGGRITLEAAVVTVDGIVAARGEPGLNPSNIGSGGGAGGVVQIIAGDVLGSGLVTAHGGAGGTGTKSAGGGGGGGMIILSTTKAAAMLSVMFDADGGASGDCKNAGAGGKGLLAEMPIAGCVDADKDGFMAADCGGDDCDDADPDIHPAKDGVSVLERCDGQDNDCNGSVDDDLPAGACPGGTCQQGVCVPDSTGPGGGASAGARPDHVEYVGGCALATRSPSDILNASIVALGAAALALSGRRRRRKGSAPLDAGADAGQTRSRCPRSPDLCGDDQRNGHDQHHK